jgi:hypothetical protein
MVLGGAVGMLRFQALNLLLNDMRFFTKKKRKRIGNGNRVSCFRLGVDSTTKNIVVHRATKNIVVHQVTLIFLFLLCFR